MTTLTAGDDAARMRLLRAARALALVTIAYNLVEGGVSTWLGAEDETLALFGFGVDSFVEVISGVGILHMVTRTRTGADDEADRFERTALRITSVCFFLLAAGLAATAAVNLLQQREPETTVWGVVISLISIATMVALIRMKLSVGRRLNSDAIVADAHCTRACLLFSIVLLAASAGYEATGLGGIDALGALMIAGLCVNEGREAWGKAKGRGCGSCGCHAGGEQLMK